MNQPTHEENYKDYHIEIYPDENAESPAAWGNEDICGWNKHFTVENKHINKNIFGALMQFEGHEAYADEAKQVEMDFHIFPLDAYVHSGIVLSLRGEGMKDRWDTSDFIGCVLVSKKEEKEKSRAEKIARGIIETWNLYLNGEVHGYVIAKPSVCRHCHHTGYEKIDSSWGIYGNASEAFMAAHEAIDAMEKADQPAQA